MGMNLVRTGSAAVVGLASGVAEPPTLGPLVLGTTRISYGTVIEAVALVGGALMQFTMPFAMPNVADGLVDGSIALLAHRGSVYALKQVAPAPAPLAVAGGQYVAPWAANPSAVAAMQNGGMRAQVGSVGRLPKLTLS